ncbi:bifunctional phosphopantothenoylcysteine decarboxylase/phosphopantothenate--cysteine ligase CoaBC [Rickettsiales bacterium]|nr:bifunctional phosphopantothenoylcysteine decarboxylase/phosphopantothenate--cysteine ligase CoaBC [Rickettsiales bacterium]
MNLKGLKVIVTSGPTREKIDPVRYISNFSSGKQGHAIAKALAEEGADVTLISGPVSLKTPDNCKIINVESAQEMLNACLDCLPVDIAICAAAVSDWRLKDISTNKIKKNDNENNLQINLVKNPDILASISQHESRPKLVVGFAAETENLIENAKSKLKNKQCDLIIANLISQDDNVFGSDENKVFFIDSQKTEELPKMNKNNIALHLCNKIKGL